MLLVNFRVRIGKMKIISTCTTYTNQNFDTISRIITKVKIMLEDSKIVIPDYFPIEISHHYGIDLFSKYGCVIINIINRAYCKKIIILFPKQKHPTHTHYKKEETFHILNGNMVLTANKNNYELKVGELFTIKQGISHSFYSENGCVFEEISTTHLTDDSYYEDAVIIQKKVAERKTLVTDWSS